MTRMILWQPHGARTVACQLECPPAGQALRLIPLTQAGPGRAAGGTQPEAVPAPASAAAPAGRVQGLRLGRFGT